MTTSTEIKIDKIRIDGNTQPRTKIDTSVVSEYAESFELNEPLPPVDVFHDGKDYWLADGFHRYHGAAKAGRKTIACKVHKGTQRDAILFSVGANAVHGLRRTNEDKRAAVMTLLNDPEWSQWSARAIAQACAVSNTFVSDIRANSVNVDTVSDVKFKTSTGKTSTHKANRKKTEKTQPTESKETSAETENHVSAQEPPAAEQPAAETTVEYRPGFDPREFDPEMKTEQPEDTTPEPTGDIPKHLVDVLSGMKQYKSLQREVSLLMGKVHALIAMPIGSYIRDQEAERNVKQFQANLKAWGFGENCPVCKNKPDNKCLKCNGRGWISQGQMGQLSDLDKEWLSKNGVNK